MAITYPLTIPSHNFRRFLMRGNTQVAVGRSPYSLKEQVQDFLGQLWVAEVTLPPLEREDAEPWITFLMKLNGPYGTFRMGDPSKKTARGSWVGSPVTNGASQQGNSLNLNGFTPTQTNVVREGDQFQIVDNLYVALNDANSDGAGAATLDIWPRLRSNYTNGTAVVSATPLGLWRMVQPDFTAYEVTEAKHYNIAFTCTETF